ncbi:MAG: hypothetical protein ACKOXG_11160 [Arenimonas sp.]|jgi:light-regulated signal transduction histidine kinase (bacteriophytochrome)
MSIRIAAGALLAAAFCLAPSSAHAVGPTNLEFSKQSIQCAYVMLLVAEATEDADMKTASTSLAETLVKAAANSNDMNKDQLMGWQSDVEKEMQTGGTDVIGQKVEGCQKFLQDKQDMIFLYSEV